MIDALITLVNENLAGYSFANVLDLCAGHGFFTDILIRANVDAENIYLVDTYFNYATLLRKYGNDKRIHIVRSDACRLKFSSKSIDLVVMSNGIHHVANADILFSEIERVMVPNGVVMILEEYREIGVSNRYTDFHTAIAESDELLGKTHFPPYSEKRLDDLIKKRKMCIVKECRISDKLNFDRITAVVQDLKRRIAKMKDEGILEDAFLINSQSIELDLCNSSEVEVPYKLYILLTPDLI